MMAIIAKADIFSWAIIAALNGTLIILIAVVTIVNWYSQIAAEKRPSGITSLLRTYHKPIDSPKTTIKTAIIICI